MILSYEPKFDLKNSCGEQQPAFITDINRGGGLGYRTVVLLQ